MTEISQSVVDRVKAIEARWGKDFMEVMMDIHDHLFGVSPVPAPPAPDAAPEDAASADAGDEGDTPNSPVDSDDAGAQQSSSGEGQPGA